MTSTAPPDNWRIIQEVANPRVWGTDFDRNDTGSETGGFAVDALGTDPGGGAEVLIETDTSIQIPPVIEVFTR